LASFAAALQGDEQVVKEMQHAVNISVQRRNCHNEMAGQLIIFTTAIL